MQLYYPAKDPFVSMATLTLLVLILLGQIITVSHSKTYHFKEVQVGLCGFLVPYPPAVGARSVPARHTHSYTYEYIVMPQGDTLYGRDIPVIKMLKRQLRNFREGRRASVTLVFYSTQAVHVRWFRRAPKLNMGLAEIPNMLPIEGDRDYKISFLSSGEVTATTLILPTFKPVFPRDFETIFTTEDGTMSYQIQTVVKETLDHRLDDVNSPEWMAVPSPTWSFHDQNYLKVHCRIFVPHEDPGWTNELSMYRAILASGGLHQVGRGSMALRPKPSTKMEFQTVVGIHKETQNYAEENGPSLMQGMRIPLRFGHVIYDVKMRTQNATSNYEGIYQCALERQWDKTYVSSAITVFGKQSPFPMEPSADLVSCERTNFDRANKVIRFTLGEETCIRCRGIGYPRPDVAIYKEEREVTPHGSWDVGVTKYINVRDAGISEATYIFWNPLPKHRGRYTCRASNDYASHYVYFQINI